MLVRTRKRKTNKVKPVLSVLVIEDQLTYLKKAYDGLTKIDISNNQLKFYGDQKKYPGATSGAEACKLIINKPLPGIIVFDNSINGDIPGLKLAYIINLTVDELQYLIDVEVNTDGDLTDSQNRIIFTAKELLYLTTNQVNYLEFLISLKTKKEKEDDLLSIIFTSEEGNYSYIPPFMTKSLMESPAVTRVYPKAGPDVALPKDFMEAINRRDIFQAMKKEAVDNDKKSRGTTSHITRQLSRHQSFPLQNLSPIKESQSLPNSEGFENLTLKTPSIEKSQTFFSFSSMDSLSSSSDLSTYTIPPTPRVGASPLSPLLSPRTTSFSENQNPDVPSEEPTSTRRLST